MLLGTGGIEGALYSGDLYITAADYLHHRTRILICWKQWARKGFPVMRDHYMLNATAAQQSLCRFKIGPRPRTILEGKSNGSESLP